MSSHEIDIPTALSVCNNNDMKITQHGSEIETILVLTGVTFREHLNDFPYAPHHILDGIGQVPSPLQ